LQHKHAIYKLKVFAIVEEKERKAISSGGDVTPMQVIF
jgi:hypothetical protein